MSSRWRSASRPWSQRWRIEAWLVARRAADRVPAGARSVVGCPARRTDGGPAWRRSSRIVPRRGSTTIISPGPSRARWAVSPQRWAPRPASEATATRPVRVTVTAAAAGRCGRASRPPGGRRRRPAPPARPTARAVRPSRAGRRRARAVARCAGRRLGMASISAVVERPAGGSEQVERLVERERVGAVGRQQLAELAQPSAERAAEPCRRPRSSSRLPRTVLISPLWAISRKGWASAHDGWCWSRSAGGSRRG
jgi:hypothetical protein